MKSALYSHQSIPLARDAREGHDEIASAKDTHQEIDLSPSEDLYSFNCATSKRIGSGRDYAGTYVQLHQTLASRIEVDSRSQFDCKDLIFRTSYGQTRSLADDRKVLPIFEVAAFLDDTLPPSLLMKDFEAQQVSASTPNISKALAEFLKDSSIHGRRI